MSLKRFIVSDLIPPSDELKMLLVLESPHTNEFSHSHPVAGQAGKKLVAQFKSKGFLRDFQEGVPLGCQIKNLSYSELGVINASSLPMDAKFYPNCLSDRDRRLTEKLSRIKKRLEKRTFSAYVPTGCIEKYLVANFTSRLQFILNQCSAKSQLLIVPCGHLATNFLNSVNIANITVLPGLPHPSARNWYTKATDAPTWSSIPKSILQ